MARSGCDAASADEANWKDLNRWPVRLRYTLENKASERKSVTMYAIGTKIDSAMMRKRGRPACHSASVYAGATRGGGLRQIDRMQVCFLARAGSCPSSYARALYGGLLGLKLCSSHRTAAPDVATLYTSKRISRSRLRVLHFSVRYERP